MKKLEFLVDEKTDEAKWFEIASACENPGCKVFTIPTSGYVITDGVARIINGKALPSNEIRVIKSKIVIIQPD